jgi:hypothetical protein
MTDWLEMTEAQKEAANDAAHAGALEYLRAHNGDRQAAYTALNSDRAYYQSAFTKGQRKRASRMDRQRAESANARLSALALIEGFIWDAEI